KTVGRLETRRRRNLVSDHALRLVPFSGCGVVSNAVGLLAGRAWFAPDRGQFSIFGVDAITFPIRYPVDRFSRGDRDSILQRRSVLQHRGHRSVVRISPDD